MNYQTPIEKFNHLLNLTLNQELVSTILFGSVARGTDTIESDIDILVIITEDNLEIRDKIIECVFVINLEFDVLISPIIMSNNNYENPLFQKTLLYRNIQAEGVIFMKQGIVSQKVSLNDLRDARKREEVE